MHKLHLIFHTIIHLRTIQIRYQLWYRMRKMWRKVIGHRYPLSIEKEGSILELQQWIEKHVSYANDEFTFLNLSKKYPAGHIDWNESEHGKLWAYNLNYMDYLLQPDMVEETGLQLIKNFIQNLPQNATGLEPYPIALRGINWIKFLCFTQGGVSRSERNGEVHAANATESSRNERNEEVHAANATRSSRNECNEDEEFTPRTPRNIAASAACFLSPRPPREISSAPAARNLSFTPRSLREISSALYAQYQILLDNLEYHLLANHLLEDGFSLLFGAFYFRDKNLYHTAVRIIEKELNEQILDDGAHFELSPMYHQIILDRLLDCINLVQNNQRFEGQETLLESNAGKSTTNAGVAKLYHLFKRQYSVVK